MPGLNEKAVSWLDDFKSINDNYGHSAADEVLVAVGKALNGCSRENEMASRFGGDEFCMLLEDLPSAETASAIAERVGEAISRPVITSAGVVSVTASVGVTVSSGEDDAEELLKSADVAMFIAKASGKGTVRAYQRGTTTAGTPLAMPA